MASTRVLRMSLSSLSQKSDKQRLSASENDQLTVTGPQIHTSIGHPRNNKRIVSIHSVFVTGGILATCCANETTRFSVSFATENILALTFARN
ncbi:hypothetical protein Bind_0818 [Beijerinckia indica subsp. indica ATCC 9039]|uniref:Uncharacterized protein n=1 Tax=Beijerinckia indica subsp. indica (strain ATCC 9039 / DSM 1715 / NCIMB 8712) TaxID=395963 RepID=B2IH54_BEII9|nr:hypothetical protein Bind_0818 [Beijerinckia indica subsp. indica ATCC 9039]